MVKDVPLLVHVAFQHHVDAAESPIELLIYPIVFCHEGKRSAGLWVWVLGLVLLGQQVGDGA